LKPVFKGKRLLSILPADMLDYITARQAEKASNATINRELAVLKRMFSLAVKYQKLHAKPHVPMLQEDNVRTGFFEPQQFEAVLAHLPAPIRLVITFAYLTGWRLKSEVLPLQWRQVDWQGRVVRLEPGSTKNGDGRMYPFTAALEALLKAQLAEHERLKKQDRLVPHVFHRDSKKIRDFRKAWETACAAAGCAGRIPHDLRRTAVRNLERSGVARSAAMQMVGHRTEAVYRLYAISDKVLLEEAAAKIDRPAGTISGTTSDQASSAPKSQSA
jgi:integrase